MAKKKIIDGILYSVIAIIFNEQNKILMFLRKGEKWEQGWEPIKGAMHINETEEQAVFREVKEEAGLENIKIIGKLPNFYRGERPWKNGKLKIKARIFVCKYIGGKIKLGEPEHIDYKWMDVEEAKEKIWLRKNIIEDAYKYLFMVNKPTFENAWKKATKSIFRLELLPEYKVPEDLVIFENWKRGQISFEEESGLWLQNLKAAKERGIKMQRVRITPLPISEYIHYEIDYWKFSVKSGEEILFLKEDDFATIKSSFNFEPEDFWLFDDEILVIFHYKDGNLVEERPIVDPAIIENHRYLKYKLLEQALPMNQFLERLDNVAKNST